MSILSATTTVADSVAHKSENLSEWIQHHVQNSGEWYLPGLKVHLPQFQPIHILGAEINLSITNHVVMLWIAGLITIALFTVAYRRKGLTPVGFGALLEWIVLFIRDEIAIANMGEEQGKRFTPLLITFFFFILVANLMGLIPLFTTATGNVNVTAALAIVTLFSTQYFGIKEHGLLGFYKSLVPHGVPFYLWPLMFVVEIMGLIAKHVALTIRLFANMVAGHIVLFAFLGLIILFKTFLVSPVSVGFGVFVYFLEMLVALIQAYIFTMLSALFIGMSVNPEH
ncbi:F0F1 ATP synthase subunit A [Caldithrix abyssi]|uniref:ATP synthase subunit a n=1 Tax=Caldithrix abyssi DSM 13497 TaxID=880073 RepID=H1XNU6_CALAY|nr:F0F1 ATP synthase subunit A [Caldithrix abyssi]APF19781.1 atpB ATP synthase F0 subcomplex A subunit [Caldithrix abyssi DSM 13497]EHO39886.1 ATP synthase subunit a [Caldithrix abyssi DSM 13497]